MALRDRISFIYKSSHFGGRNDCLHVLLGRQKAPVWPPTQVSEKVAATFLTPTTHAISPPKILLNIVKPLSSPTHFSNMELRDTMLDVDPEFTQENPQEPHQATRMLGFDVTRVLKDAKAFLNTFGMASQSLPDDVVSKVHDIQGKEEQVCLTSFIISPNTILQMSWLTHG